MSMRVLLYSRVNPADGGGVQAVVNRLATYLRGHGHAVVKAWSVPNPDREAGDLTSPLPHLVRRRGLPAPRSTLDVCRALIRLAWALSRYRPEIVNVHFVTRESIYFLLLKSLFRYKVVLSAHGSDVLRPKPWDAPLLPRVLARADAITAVSPLTAARVQEVAGADAAQVHVIPNGVDYDFWSAPAPDPDVSDRPPVVLAVGRLHPVKGHDVLLHAFSRVLELLPAARLVIAGDGGWRADLERLVRQLGLTAAVEFTGQLDPEEVRWQMWKARGFVLPSRSEGLPLTLLEALATGLPAVATAVGGVPDVLVPGTGVLVPPEDPAALAGALLGVLLNPGLTVDLSRRGKQRARKFSAAAADAAYEELLLQVVDRRSHSESTKTGGEVAQDEWGSPDPARARIGQ